MFSPTFQVSQRLSQGSQRFETNQVGIIVDSPHSFEHIESPRRLFGLLEGGGGGGVRDRLRGRRRILWRPLVDGVLDGVACKAWLAVVQRANGDVIHVLPSIVV